jgi:hypothetical protein
MRTAWMIGLALAAAIVILGSRIVLAPAGRRRSRRRTA